MKTEHQTMGLLKHAILPLYALLDLGLVFQTLVAEDISEVAADVGREDLKTLPLTPLELHLIHAMGATMIVLLVNNVAAVLMENSHYHGMAVLLQILFHAVDGCNYAKMGLGVPPFIWAIVGVGVVGLFVHSRETMIFAKDNGSRGNIKNG